ncbi:MAG: LPS translocon maturation chaperone LptM [Lysobacterales bacterium]|jgi:predicted small lipoprotein YifL
MKGFRTLLTLALMAVALNACGNKGALYLPEDGPPGPPPSQEEEGGEEDGA